MAGILKGLPLPLVLCDWRLRIVCESAAGLRARAAWALGDDRARLLNVSGREPLPQDLADFCRAKIMAWEQGTPRERARLEKREYYLDHPCLPQMRAKLSLLRQKEFPLIKPVFLLRFEMPRAGHDAVTRSQLVVDNAGSLTQLSAAEQEVALLVCQGQSNANVAQQLGKSVHTIKAQLHSIFEKLRVKSRSKLTALLMRGSVYLLSVFSCNLLFDTVGL